MTARTIPDPASESLRSAGFILQKMHEAIVEASEALAPLPLLESAEGETYRHGVLGAGVTATRLALLGVEFAICLGRLQAAGGE